MSENTIDQQFIEYVVKSLVGNPDAVSIERTIDEKGVLLLLTVDPEDLGRVIGKRGATAQSLRTLLRALGTKNEARYNLKIVDNGYPKPDRQERRDDDTRTDSKVDESKTESAKEETSDAEKNSDSDVNENNNDSSSSDDGEAPAPVEEKPAAEPEVESEPEANERETSIERTRRELEDLDDLDI